MNRNGQIAPFMVLVMAVLILAIAATILIGEAGFTRVRLANIVDGALISSASDFARNLNRIRQIQRGSGGLQVNYIGLQTFLATRMSNCLCPLPMCTGAPPMQPSAGMPMYGVWETIWSPMIQPMFYMSMYNLTKLYETAEDIADDMPESLRSSLYDVGFGGGLLDEPKPFIEGGDCWESGLDEKGRRIPRYCNENDGVLHDEVLRDEDGRVKDLDYEAYGKRDSLFTEQYKNLKRSNTEWYDNDTLTYSFNKSIEFIDTGSDVPGEKQKVKCPGKLNQGDPLSECSDGSGEYEGYLKVALDNVTHKVKVQPQPMVLLYLYQVPVPFTCIIPAPFGFTVYPACYCQTLPAFIPIPKGWIRSVDIGGGGTRYGMTLEKQLPFKREPLLFKSSAKLKQRSKIRITGSFSSGYEFKLEE